MDTELKSRSQLIARSTRVGLTAVVLLLPFFLTTALMEALGLRSDQVESLLILGAACALLSATLIVCAAYLMIRGVFRSPEYVPPTDHELTKRKVTLWPGLRLLDLAFAGTTLPSALILYLVAGDLPGFPWVTAGLAVFGIITLVRGSLHRFWTSPDDPLQ